MSTASTTIIGRETELATLDAFLGGLQDGPDALVIAGASGVGKTTLWRVGLEVAADRGFRVLAASPTSIETSLPFVVLDDLLSSVVESVVVRLPSPQRRALEAALLLADAGDEAVDPRAVSVAFLTVLRELAQSGPVLVAVDDVQWVDAASARALSYAGRRLQDQRVGMLATRRITGEGATDPDQLLTGQRVSSLVVGPLSLGALHKLIRERLGLVLPRPAMRRVHDTTGGNPFYALEVARAIERQGSPVGLGTVLPVPSTLDELLRSRLDALPRRTRGVLLAAASAADARVSVISAALQIDARVALAPAVHAHIVTLDGDRLAFGHPLLAEAAYAAADEDSRQRAHRALADVVVGPEERARHLALAAQRPNEAVAAALERAAAEASARGATARAAGLSQRALELTPAPRSEGGERRAMETARYLFDAGDTMGARTLIEKTLPSLRGSGARGEALVQLQRVYRFDGDQLRAAELARDALATDGADPRVRAAAAQGLAFTLFFMREDLPAALDYANLASDATLADASEAFRLETLNATGLLQAVLGRPEAEATLRSAQRLGADDRVDVLNSARWARLFLSHWTDELSGVADAVRACRSEAVARGQDGSLPMILALEGLVRYLTGDWRRAVELLEEGHDLALQTGQRPQQAYTLSVRALLHASRGRLRRRERTLPVLSH